MKNDKNLNDEVVRTLVEVLLSDLHSVCGAFAEKNLRNTSGREDIDIFVNVITNLASVYFHKNVRLADYDKFAIEFSNNLIATMRYHTEMCKKEMN